MSKHVSLKIQNGNEMCDQHKNERSSEFDGTREVYNQINNLHDSSRFKFTHFSVSTDSITCTRSVMNAWSESVLSPIFLAKTL